MCIRDRSFTLLTRYVLSTSAVYLPASSAGDLPYPNTLTGECDVSRITALESGFARGTFRGIYAPQHAYSSLSDIAYPLPDGRIGKLAYLHEWGGQTDGKAIIDLIGPW